MGVLTVHDLADPSVREQVKIADVIFGADPRTGAWDLFYGESTLKRIRDKGEEEVNLLFFSLDFATEELEFLVSSVVVLKGSRCYKGEGMGPLVADTN